MKPYSDVSLDISVLGCLGKVKKELDPEDGHLSLDETTKLLQDLQEVQAERGGSRPSSNLSSLSSASDRERHHLGSPSRLSVGEQQEAAHDPYEFLQPPQRPSLQAVFGGFVLLSFYLRVQSFCHETKTSSCPLRPVGAAPGSW